MITLYEEIEKAKKPYPAVIRRMRRMIKKEQPELINQVQRLWKNQQNIVSYAELRECVKKKELTERIWKNWTEDYATFINTKMHPKWVTAMKEGAKEVSEKKGRFIFTPESKEVQKWVKQHSAELVTNISDNQKQAINALIQRATELKMTPDELSKMIRPVIGLSKPQTVANGNYYHKVKNELLKNNSRMKVETAEKRAREAAAKYAERQHRSRAMTIAQNELAMAYSNGEYLAIKQAQEEGLLGKMMKQVMTSGVDVCKGCQDLEGNPIPVDEEFPTMWGGMMTYPFHVNCHCCVEYIEVEAPTFKGVEEVKKRMNFKISKANEDKKQVFGWANIAVTKEGTPIQDLQNDMVEPEELEKAAYEHVLSFRSTGERHDPNLRQKGRLIESIVFTKEKLEAMNIPEGTLPYGWWVGYQIDDDKTWAKIKKGEYQMFSIEGTAQRQPVDKSNQSVRTAKSYKEIMKDL